MDCLVPTYSDSGSTKKTLEASVMGFFNRYLEEMEDSDG